MRIKRIRIVTILLASALIALLFIQYSWIDRAVKNSAEKFRDKVYDLGMEVVKEVEEDTYCIGFYSELYLDGDEEFVVHRYNDSTGVHDSVPLLYHYISDKKDTLMEFSSLDMSYPMEIDFNVKVTLLPEQEDDPTMPAIGELPQMPQNFEIDLNLLDSLLKLKFRNNGINEDFEYLLADKTESSVVHRSTELNDDEVRAEGTLIPIFPNDRFRDPFDLFVYFPSTTAIAFSSIAFVVSSSAVLVVVLIILFAFFLKMLANQRRLAEMKVDFVNNMTHEFKTPLSNINLAVSSLTGSVNEESQKVLDIITEENERLQEGIELVLSTALIDKTELVLKKEKKDLHEILTRVARNNELSTAKIKLDLAAKNSTLMVDELHVVNVFSNLIDNAVKYSDKSPEIEIKTSDKAGKLKIDFKDNGKGIDSQDLPHVFEKFSRVSTQDRFEVKGFGIGLYYVKMILDAHKGKVFASSTKGVGSVFTLLFPLEA